MEGTGLRDVVEPEKSSKTAVLGESSSFVNKCGSGKLAEPCVLGKICHLVYQAESRDPDFSRNSSPEATSGLAANNPG